MSILTLDLGTTYFKAAVFGRDGRIEALHREPTPITPACKGCCEVAPGAFKDAVSRCFGQLRQKRSGGLADIEAITFATQTNSFILLDRHDEPLTFLILWPDARAKAFEPQVQRIAAAPGFLPETGLPELGFEFMAAKLLWIRENQPHVWEQTRRVCLISDYLTLLLTGRHTTEASTAGLTGLVNIHTASWRRDAVAALGLNLGSMPPIARTGTDLGQISPEAADRAGLPRTCRFVAGCLDQFAGAVGAGNIASGGISETTGTVLACVRCSDIFAATPPVGVYQGPAFDAGKYFAFCFGTTSAGLLEQYVRRLPDAPEYAVLDDEASKVAPGCDGLRARATDAGLAFQHVTPAHTRGHHVRAIMEAVALALARQVRQLCGDAAPAAIRSTGGAARSDVWLQIKSDVLGTSVEAGDCPEPTSLGAAMLAARSLGWGTLDELAREWIRTRSRKIPDGGRHAQYLRLARQLDPA